MRLRLRGQEDGWRVVKLAHPIHPPIARIHSHEMNEKRPNTTPGRPVFSKHLRDHRVLPRTQVEDSECLNIYQMLESGFSAPDRLLLQHYGS